MPQLLSFEAIVRDLVGQGVPREKAERAAAGEMQATLSTVYRAANGQEIELPVPAIAWPIRLTLPWSALTSDNEKYTVGGGTKGPRLILTDRYRVAKATTRAIARRAVGPAEPAAVPLELLARVWVPDHRPHDVVNFAKCAHDGLEEAVFTNDRWLYRAVWERAGVDVDAPRAEITITPHPGESTRKDPGRGAA